MQSNNAIISQPGTNVANPSVGTVPVNSNLSTATPTTNLIGNQTQPNGLVSDQNRLTRSATVPATAAVAPGAAAAPTALVPSEPIILPSWASNTANAVAARQASVAPFNIEGRYVVKPAFLKVLRAVEGVNQAQVVFPYREVSIHII